MYIPTIGILAVSKGGEGRLRVGVFNIHVGFPHLQFVNLLETQFFVGIIPVY